MGFSLSSSADQSVVEGIPLSQREKSTQPATTELEDGVTGLPRGRVVTFDVSHLTCMFAGITTPKFCVAGSVAGIKR